MHSSAYTERELERHKALYYAECSCVDERLGKMLDALDRQGLTDDTMVVVVSDHGTELADHGQYSKNKHRCRYRHNTEIICAMRFPGKEFAGRRVKGFVQNHDLVPTILGHLGVEHPAVDGLNVMPLIRGEKDDLRDHIISGWSQCAAVRTHGHVYSCDCESEDLNEYLFDVKADPDEMNNVATQQPDVTAELRGKLEAFFGEILPVARRDKQYPGFPPVKTWVEKAPWAESIREIVK